MVCCDQYGHARIAVTVTDLPKEPGNEVCDIINCVAKKVPSTGFKETEVAQSFERYGGMFTYS